MSDNTFDSEKSWQNVQGSRSKPRKGLKPYEGSKDERADAVQAGITGGATTAGEALGQVWDNLKSAVGLGSPKKKEE